MDREIIRTGNTGGRQGSSPAVMIKDILGIILRNWFWFALCLLVALVAAFFYVKSKQPVYARSASIMVRSNVSDTDRTLKELGIRGNTNAVPCTYSRTCSCKYRSL